MHSDRFQHETALHVHSTCRCQRTQKPASLRRCRTAKPIVRIVLLSRPLGRASTEIGNEEPGATNPPNWSLRP
jgi:hypothetical protein